VVLDGPRNVLARGPAVLVSEGFATRLAEPPPRSTAVANGPEVEVLAAALATPQRRGCGDGRRRDAGHGTDRRMAADVRLRAHRCLQQTGRRRVLREPGPVLAGLGGLPRQRKSGAPRRTGSPPRYQCLMAQSGPRPRATVASLGARSVMVRLLPTKPSPRRPDAAERKRQAEIEAAAARQRARDRAANDDNPTQMGSPRQSGS
jgi:hypothetical protein